MWQAFASILAVATLAPAAAPTNDIRRKDLDVEMVLDTPGRTGACDVLRFTPDGKHLLAAGDDKVVRVWDCTDKGLTPSAVPVLRWSIFREQRGGIYALDVAPDPKNEDGFLVVVSGIGLIKGTAAVLDSRGGVRYGLPPFPPGREEQESLTLAAVWSIAFAPGGDRVAFGGSDGSVWLWDLSAKAVRFLGRHPGQDGTSAAKQNEVRLVAFRGTDRLLSVAADGWVLDWDLKKAAAGPRKVFQFEKVKNLECVALDRTKQWLAAGGQTFAEGEKSSTVELRSVDGSRYKALKLADRNFPKRLAFDAASRRLAVATYVTSKPPDFYLLFQGGTFLFDVSQDDPEPVAGPKNSYYLDSVAFHPDGNRLALAGGDDQEVTLWDIRQLPAKLLSKIAGPGRGLWGVGLSKDSRYLGYRDQRTPVPDHPNHLGQGPWQVFDLQQRRFVLPAEARAFDPVAPLQEADGWKVVPDEILGRVWYVVKGDTKHKVPLQGIDKLPRCYTFLKADEDHPTRLVVGHIWGMSVFALGKGEPKLVRKFAGHQGEVMAVAPSADGKFLVTASRDQTLGVWSLLPQKNQDELGASFEEKGDQLVVKAVAAGSPAWEAHLEPGDAITWFGYGGKKAEGGPAEWHATLRGPTPGLVCDFYLERGGVKNLYTMTTNRQRPLARFFPMSNREWVLYRYYDFYYDCSTNGDRYLAWQLSGEVDTPPRFDPLERYRKRFFKPEKVASLFSDLGANPERVSLTDIEPPQVAFAASPDKLAGGVVRLSISARSVAADRPEQRLSQVNLWVNGAIVQEWKDVNDTKFLLFYDLPAEQLRRGTNVLTVQAYNRAEVRHQAEARVEYTKPEAPGNLYALVIGIGNYQKSNSGLSDLSAGKDALAVGDVLGKQKKLFSNVNVVTLRDEKASRDRILGEMSRLAKEVKPDDTFILFLAGHGASGREINTEATKRVESGKSRGATVKIAPHLFVFCTPEFDIEKALASGLPSEELYREVRRLNCRTLVLLDACHSGTIVEDPVRQLTPEGVGPVILSACEPREPAAEDRTLGRIYTQDRADGLFTIALILALEREFPRADANGDRVLTAAELNDYLRRRVPALLKNRVGEGQGQHPTGSLPRLEKDLPVASR
jgi:WD40 repeat protein